MFRRFCFFSVCAIIGCNPAEGPPTRIPQASTRLDPSATDPVSVVRRIVGKHLNIPAEQIAPEKTFADHGLDSLDLVEIYMLVEDELRISIDDKSLSAVSGGVAIEEIPGKLTIAGFARVVSDALPGGKGDGNR
jgi:acyl carrier protein